MRLALLALLVPSVATAAPSPTETFVGKLGQLGCGPISRLAPVLGTYRYTPKQDSMANLAPLTYPLGELGKLGITKVTVHLAFDIYHHDPKDDKDPMVDSIDFALDGKTTLDGVIGALPGATHFGTVWHAGSLYYKQGLLTFDCGSPPDWARPPWSEAGRRALEARVIDVLDHKTPSGMRPDPKDPSKSRSDDDWHELGIYKDWWYVHFRTPIPAAAILKAIGATSVVLRATDVHRSHWKLFHADGSPILYKDWRIDIDVVEDGLEKSNSSKPLDGTKLLITTINAHK